METKKISDKMKKAVQREDRANNYLKRIIFLLNSSNVMRTSEDIESRRNKLGFFKDDITGNQLDDHETYLVNGKFFTNLRFAYAIQEDNPVIIIETVQQAKYRYKKVEKALCYLSTIKEPSEKTRKRIEPFIKSKEQLNEDLFGGLVNWAEEIIDLIYELHTRERGKEKPRISIEDIEFLDFLVDFLSPLQDKIKSELQIYIEQIRESCTLPNHIKKKVGALSEKDDDRDALVRGSYFRGLLNRKKENLKKLRFVCSDNKQMRDKGN